MAVLHTPAGAVVKIIERGSGTPVVFLHSGVGSAGEWRQVFELWPEGHRLVAVDAYGAVRRSGSAGGTWTRSTASAASANSRPGSGGRTEL